MKTLELDLKKKVLIIDAENGFNHFKIYDDEIGFIFIENGIPRKELIKGSYKFLCKGSELTEGIAREFMSDFDAFNQFTLNYEYLKNLIYMIANKGFYWLENPIEIIERGEDTEHNRVLNQNKWQEAEEKTFKNPLIFVKK